MGVLRTLLSFMSSFHTFANKIIIQMYKQLKPEGLDSKKSSSLSRQSGGASLGLSALAGRLQRGGTPRLGGGLASRSQLLSPQALSTLNGRTLHGRVEL